MAGEECSMISLGSSHCLALGRGGDCFVWGDNESGQLGLGHLTNQPVVSINNSFPAVKQVACGANHSIVLTEKGQVRRQCISSICFLLFYMNLVQIYTWGHGQNGRLGNGETERIAVPEKEKHAFPVPILLRTLETVYEISCGADYALARGDSGVWAWGNGSGGKLGLGDINDRYEPNLIPKLRGKSVLRIYATAWYAMAIVAYPPILEGGYVFSWGSGYHGQLGLGASSVSMQPQMIEFFVHSHTMIKELALGPSHVLAITKENELYSWGSNAHGALGR
jgi:alpha-tubulin suppressor-like RCC1 family protein